jgi:hypothetical protein
MIRFVDTVPERRRRGQNGSAMIVVLALLALLLIYVLANIRTLSSLGRELKLLDQRQTQRLRNSPHPAHAVTNETNSISATAKPN